MSKRSYAKGFQLALGHLGIWLTIGTLTFLFANSGWWFAALIMLFLHGTIGTFFIAPWQNSHTELFSKPKSRTHFFLRFLSPRLAQFPGLPSEPQLPSSLRLTFSRLQGIGFTESAVTKAAISPAIVHLHFTGGFESRGLIPTLKGFWGMATDRLNHPHFSNWDVNLFDDAPVGRQQSVQWARLVLGFHTGVLIFALRIR